MVVRDFVGFFVVKKGIQRSVENFRFPKNIVRCYILRKADVFCVWVKIYWQK